jgi:phosphonate transport system permease protein
MASPQIATAGFVIEAGQDPVRVFEKHRAELIRSRLMMNIGMALLFLVLLAISIVVSRFYPDRLWAGLPRIFEYFGTVMPNLEGDKLFLARGADGKAVEGSILYWYSDLGKYLQLLFETILMAITATMLGAGMAFLLSFPAARNLAPARWINLIARRTTEVFRGVPEIVMALVLVFAVGIGPLAGVIAIAIHTAGALGKLFSEVNENASMRPVEGMRSVGGTWFDEVRFGVVPQVLPNFVSYSLLRFEINVRASSIVGFVGAGGIGQELNHTISFYNDDRVMAVLIMIVVLVTVIDLISERLRTRLIGRENLI